MNYFTYSNNNNNKQKTINDNLFPEKNYVTMIGLVSSPLLGV